MSRKVWLGLGAAIFLIGAGNSAAFTMLYHISNVGAPAFTDYGFEPSYIVYEQFLYDHNESRKQAIKQYRLTHQANKIRHALPAGSFVQLDIEGWNSTNDDDQPWIREQYRSTLARMKELLPDYRLGYYRIVPVWAHWDMHKNERLRVGWQEENRQRQAIADLSDVLYPALYTYHSDPEKWLATARLVLNKARRMAGDKPVIPFIWPHFHPSSDIGGKGKLQIPREYWRIQLEFVRQHADGFILWNDGRTRIWSDAFPWWQATLAFLKQHFPERLPAHERAAPTSETPP